MKREDYFDQAATWAADTQSASMRSRRIAWTLGGIAFGVAALEAVALAMLTPLKTVQPITLLVDRQTGFVQALDPQSPRRIVADDALTQSFLAQYVLAREGYDRATVASSYRKVALLSAGNARSTYLAGMAAGSPSSPFVRYPEGMLVTVRVKSVSRLNPGIALVRFDTFEQPRGSISSVGQPWIAVVRYRYNDAPMGLEDRLVNPLGFQVLSYRRDAEAPLESGAPTATVTLGTAGAGYTAPPSQSAPAAASIGAIDGPASGRIATQPRTAARTKLPTPPADPSTAPGNTLASDRNIPMGSPLQSNGG